MADVELPVRISAAKGHPDFNPIFRHVVVLLDGQPMRGVTWADRSAGVIELYPLNDHGRLLQCGDRFLTTTLHGEVRFLLRGGARG